MEKDNVEEGKGIGNVAVSKTKIRTTEGNCNF
jgi:hypothetical protein